MDPHVKKKRTPVINAPLVNDPPLFENLDNLEEPEPGSPGSIEQQLDMCETGELRGDDIDHSLRFPERERMDQEDSDPLPLDEIFDELRMDMSLQDREGDEMSGDDHSSGLQGGEEELRHHPGISTGMPGDKTEHDEMEQLMREKKRAA